MEYEGENVEYLLCGQAWDYDLQPRDREPCDFGQIVPSVGMVVVRNLVLRQVEKEGEMIKLEIYFIKKRSVLDLR